jgi:hypothetical protein
MEHSSREREPFLVQERRRCAVFSFVGLMAPSEARLEFLKLAKCIKYKAYMREFVQPDICDPGIVDTEKRGK